MLNEIRITKEGNYWTLSINGNDVSCGDLDDVINSLSDCKKFEDIVNRFEPNNYLNYLKRRINI